MQPDHLGRREVVLGGASLAAGWVLAPSLVAGRAFAGESPFKISLAQWSLHRAIRGGDLDHLDFAKASRRDYGIDAIEYVSQFFQARAADTEYLDEMRRRASDEGVRSLLIMIDGVGALGAPDEATRTKAVEGHRPWLDAAAALGCHAIRVNARSDGSRNEQLAHTSDGLRRLCEHAEALELSVIVENHGGLSSDGAWLARLMRTVDHPRCGTLPDFGNFRIGLMKTYDPYRGVTEMMPWARAVSAKSHDFDERGNEKTIDYARMMGIVLDAGYHGHVGIEYEGGRLGEPEGIRATKRLLERVRDEVTAKAAE